MSPVLVNPSRFGAAPSATFATVAAALSPTAWYRLGDAVGSGIAADSSGNGHNVSVASGVTFGTTGLVAGDSDTAATLSGTVSTQVAYGSWMDAPTALSVFAIGKTTSSAGMMLISRDDGVASHRVWQFGFDAARLTFVKIAGSVVTALSSGTYNDGLDHDFGATYDGSNIRLYADGVKVATQAAAGSMGTVAGRLFLGARFTSNGDPANFWNGVLDEAIYKAGAVWTDTDFANLHAARV